MTFTSRQAFICSCKHGFTGYKCRVIYAAHAPVVHAGALRKKTVDAVGGESCKLKRASVAEDEGIGEGGGVKIYLPILPYCMSAASAF